MSRLLDRISVVMQTILVVLLTLILGLWVWALATGRGGTDDEMLRTIYRQQLVTLCVLSVGVDDRTPAKLADCQAEAAAVVPPLTKGTQ